jgi:hypothetical protein
LFVKTGYSQLNIKRSYELNVTNLILRDITFVFTQRLNDNNSLEISNGFTFSKTNKTDVTPFLFIEVRDPHKLYYLYRLRIGNRFYFSDNIYFAPMLIFNYAWFNNGTITEYINLAGDAYDEDWTMNREKYEIGTIIKLGRVQTFKTHFLHDFYWGLGIKYRIGHEDILKKVGYLGEYIEDDYPIHNEYTRWVPTIHFGIMIGAAELK